MSDPITIIVPTLNRPKVFGCVIDYLSNSFSGPIVVVDNSTPSDAAANESAVKNTGNKKINYIQLPDDTEVLPKFLHGVNAVETKFTVFCGDDDFIVPSVLPEAIKILEDDNGIRAVNGRGLLLHLGDNPSLFIRNYRQRGCEGPHWTDRLNTLVRPYSSTFYNVQFTEDVQFVFDFYAKNESPARFSETFFSFATVMRGGIRRLDKLFLIRGTDEPDRASDQLERFSSFIFDPDFSVLMNQFIQNITTYAEVLHGPLNDAQKDFIKKAMSDMLAINLMCDKEDKHQIGRDEDKSDDQKGWTSRFNDLSHPDSAILSELVARYLSVYQ